MNKGEGIRVFYETLLEQNPKSLIALKWCVEHGVNPTALDPNKAVLLLKQRLAKHKEQQKQVDSSTSAGKKRSSASIGSNKTKNRKKSRKRAQADASDFMSAGDVGLGVDAGGYTEDMLGMTGL